MAINVCALCVCVRERDERNMCVDCSTGCLLCSLTKRGHGNVNTRVLVGVYPAVLLCIIGWKINSNQRINYRSQKLQILVKVRINSRDIIIFP